MQAHPSLAILSVCCTTHSAMTSKSCLSISVVAGSNSSFRLTSGPVKDIQFTTKTSEVFKTFLTLEMCEIIDDQISSQSTALFEIWCKVIPTAEYL